MNRQLWHTLTKPSKGKLAYVERYAKGKSLLDVGCAQGWYAKKAQEMGFEVLAVDLENFMKVEGVEFRKIQPGQIAPSLDCKFDTVLMFDVLEHLEDEEQALSDLVRVCQGRVIISVPNEDDKNLADYNLTLLNRKDTTHQRYYTLDGLRSKIEKHGFKIVHLSYEGATLPGILGEYIRPSILGRFTGKLLNKLFFWGVFKCPYWGDIYAVADKEQDR